MLRNVEAPVWAKERLSTNTHTSQSRTNKTLLVCHLVGDDRATYPLNRWAFWNAPSSHPLVRWAVWSAHSSHPFVRWAFWIAHSSQRYTGSLTFVQSAWIGGNCPPPPNKPSTHISPGLASLLLQIPTCTGLAELLASHLHFVTCATSLASLAPLVSLASLAPLASLASLASLALCHLCYVPASCLPVYGAVRLPGIQPKPHGITCRPLQSRWPVRWDGKLWPELSFHVRVGPDVVLQKIIWLGNASRTLGKRNLYESYVVEECVRLCLDKPCKDFCLILSSKS